MLSYYKIIYNLFKEIAMHHTNLKDLIFCLEYGTNIHINIVFLENHINNKLILQQKNVYHSKPYCTFMKSSQDGLSKCVKCRNKALNKAVMEKRGFGGLCINGVYEYCYPVIENDSVLAVIFLGNILPTQTKNESEFINQFSHTFEKDFSEEKCKLFCSILENQIKFLIKEYDKNVQSPIIITNIKNYIDEFFASDLSVSDIARVFNYHEKYLGKIFKKHINKSIHEYINNKRLNEAQKLLRNNSLPIVEIASQVGFNNVTYFNRLFKKKFNLSPTDYRNQQNTN